MRPLLSLERIFFIHKKLTKEQKTKSKNQIIKMKYFFYGMKNPIYVERETEQQQKNWNFENEKQKKKDKNSIPFSVLFFV